MTAHTLDRVASVSTDALASIVRGVVRDPASWQTEVRFGATERWWTRLRGDDLLDVWLLTWVHDTGTDPHDHGDSAGAFTVVSGQLEEVRLDRASRELTVARIHPGEVREIPRGVVHDVRSPSLTPAISIHAYSPPLREMTYYPELAVDLPLPSRHVLADHA